MSDIRTASDLQQEMSAEFAWRRKELHSVRSMVESREEGHEQDMRIRAAIALLYAHWEGFVKRIGGFYLEFVARQQLKHDELSASFLALAVRQISGSASSGGSTNQSMEVVKLFRSDYNSRSNLGWRSGIRTKSNLKSDVFREIILSLGLDYSRFATKEKLIDERLVRNRNEIAHGQYLLIRLAQYIELHEVVVTMMDDFYNQIENSVLTGGYRV